MRFFPTKKFKCLTSTFFPGTLPWLLAPAQKPKRQPDVLQTALKKCFTLHAECVARFFCPSDNYVIDLCCCRCLQSPLLHFLMIFRVVFQSSGQHRKLSLIAEPTRRLVMCKVLLSHFDIYTRCRDVSLCHDC